jgi:hypothetical protein
MDPREQAQATAEWQKLLRQIQAVVDRLDPLGVFGFAEDREFVRDEYEGTALWILRQLRGCRSETDALKALVEATNRLWGDRCDPTPPSPEYTDAAGEIWQLFDSSPVRQLLGDPQVAPGGPLG